MKAKVDNFLDHISVARKTAILIVVITAGVLFLGTFGQLNLNGLKNKFNNFYDIRFEAIATLDEIKTLYALELGSDVAQEKSRYLWNNYKKLTFALDKKDAKTYKNLIKNIDTKIYEVQTFKTQPIKLYENLALLTKFHLNMAKKDKELLNKEYGYAKWMTIGLSLFLVLFSILFTYSIIKNTKNLIKNLSNVVKSKIDDYESLTHQYEDKVTKEVTRNREKDQIMYQHARLAAMGEMIGNIAHQWRQPLNALTVLIQGFGTKSMAGKLDQKFIDQQISEGLRLSQQMSDTIEDFRNFFSPHREREYFSISKSLEDTLELVEFFCKDEHIDIIVDAKDDLRVFGYSNEFSQVILNLINNARDNFKHRNKNDERKILIKLEKRGKPKPYAIISFIDNGGGIDPVIIDRIFEPYFTTKHKSTGTGIGLYMSKQIIEKQMQGVVSVKNIEKKLDDGKLHKCANFTIAIPIK